MIDIVELIKNLQTLTVNDSAFQILKDFERVLDELDLYVYKNWENGELYAGPDVNRYTVTCKFIWPYKEMPDPDGGKLLSDYGCEVTYQRSFLMIPRKVHKPSDFRPGTKKGKIDAHPIWLVSVSMPKKLMQDIYQGYNEKDSNRLANLMKYDKSSLNSPGQIMPEPRSEAEFNAPPQAPQPI